MRQYGDAVGAAEAGGERRHGRTQHVHVRIALGQHPPRGIGGNEQRLRLKAATLFDPRPQQSQRAEFRHGQELIGIGAKPRIDHAPRLFQSHAGALQRAQIGDAGRQHERQLLHFRSAGIMDHPSVGNRERALESHRGETFDRAGDRGRDLGPGIGTGSPDRAGADRIETEADVARRRADALALDIFGDVDGRHPRLRTDLKVDGNAGIDEDAVEHLLDRLRCRIQPKAVGAIGAREYQRQPGGAVLEIVHRLRVGRCGIRMIDPLHDLPGRGRGPAGDRCGIAGALIDRFDLQAVIGLADQLLERRALQHAIDQLAPVVIGRGREIRRQPQVVGLQMSFGRSLPGAVYCWPEIATCRPPSQTVVFGETTVTGPVPSRTGRKNFTPSGSTEVG